MTQRRTRMVVLENFGSCNMRCSYCFPEHLWARQGLSATMSEDTLRGTLELAFDTPGTEPVDVRFAGGEPLLAGHQWLESAFATAREVAARHGKSVTLSLQTNATLVTHELADLLAENDVQVGVSLDGDGTINDITRGKTDRTLRGFSLLTEAYGHVPGVIVTVTRANARRMHDVVAYLESLGVALFRANLMGATASWNAVSAPRAEEWATARQDLLVALAERDGRILEVNVSQAVTKLVGGLLASVPAFDQPRGCCAMRCPAGTELMYFDRQGDAYPCPRANVTPSARVAHYADADFDDRWDGALLDLDAAMAVPDSCATCPAQLVCDYGCHAFNEAEGNFFEVNCDASKAVFGWLPDHLEQVARVFLLSRRRADQRGRQDWAPDRRAATLPDAQVRALAGELSTRLAAFLSAPAIDPSVLDRRYGWSDELVPQRPITRPRVAGPGQPPRKDGHGRDHQHL